MAGWSLSCATNCPSNLINFEYDLINQQSQTLVTSGIIPLIPANGVAKDSTQLNNMTVLEGTLTAELKNLSPLVRAVWLFRSTPRIN